MARKSEQTKGDAVVELIRDECAERMSPTSYRRVCRAIKTLGLDSADQQFVLVYLDYHSPRHPSLPYARFTKSGSDR